MSLRFPDQTMSAAEWRRRWKAAGVFMEEPGEHTHARIWWGEPGFCVTVHHSPHGHGAGGRATSSSSSQGPLITDHCADAATVPAEKTWRTFVAGQSGFSDTTTTPAEACALLPKEKRKECNRLAAIALAGRRCRRLCRSARAESSGTTRAW